MSESVYDWTPGEIEAALEAYNAAPEELTVSELRSRIDAARDAQKAASQPPSDDELSRDVLVQLCKDGLVPQALWSNRDSSSAQIKLATAGALLQSGCDYTILREPGGLNTDAQTIWLRIEWEGFGYFDYDGGLDSDTFYLPTRARLNEVAGKDWY